MTPNRAGSPNPLQVVLRRGGHPVDSAKIKATISMAEMDMGSLTGHLPRIKPGVYARTAPALGMSGRYDLRLDVTPAASSPSRSHSTTA
jgi:hypothetical protein